MIKNDKIILKNEKNEDCIFSILLTFDLEEKNKSYVIYTDYSKNEDENIKIYSSIYNKNGDLEPIIEADEIEIVNEYIKTLENDIKSKIEFY